MRRPAWLLLLHPAFLFSLAILILNDNWWKYSYPGWLTGKLSDFAGVLVFTVFLFVLMSGKKLLVACISALVFLWWKSSLSDSFIFWINNYLHLPVKRVVDYSDDLAILIIPFCFYLKPVTYRISYSVTNFLKPVLFTGTLVAICATSAYRVSDAHYTKEHLFLNKGFKTHLTENEILGKLDSMQIPYHKDSIEIMPVYPRDYLLRTNAGLDSPVHWVELGTLKDTLLYYKRYTLPFFIIPRLALENDTLFNVIFRINIGRRVNEINLVSAEVPPSIDINIQKFDMLQKKYRSLLKSILADQGN
jgi:hypothetical protein